MDNTTGHKEHATKAKTDEDHPRLRGRIHKERHVKIICIGAGASGLLFAYKLQRSFDNFELTLYEKNDDIGGTWLENRYPGCACDVQAHNYTWSFEPKTDWTSTYAGAEEIFGYFDTFSKKYGLRKYCKFKHRVSSARWDDAKGGWDIDILDSNTGSILRDHCDILVNGTGVLNNWKWPEIPGLHDFKGELVHTAHWDANIDLTGKHVGVIGNGSSGIQVVPAILPQVSKITTFIRSPTWAVPMPGFEQHVFSDQERANFAAKPEIHLQHRRKAEGRINSGFGLFIMGTRLQKRLHAQMLKATQEKLRGHPLREKLIPDWTVGCRRITSGPDYLEALCADNVHVVYGGVDRITERGCVGEDGQEYPVDVLVCATGFDASFTPHFPIIGSSGKSLADEWAGEARGYLGIAVPNFPNYLVFLGPNSPGGNGPLLIAIEAQADYMLKLIDRWQTENIHSFSPKKEAVDDLTAHKDQFMKKTAWTQGCRSWYKNNTVSGKVIAIWPGSTLHYLEAISEARYDDWDIKYTGNRFAFLGNGTSRAEIEAGGDMSYYIRDRDDGSHLSKTKRWEHVWKRGTRSAKL